MNSPILQKFTIGARDARERLRSAREIDPESLHPEEAAMLRIFGRTVEGMERLTREQFDAECNHLRSKIQ
jgi:hypothetical protein